MRRVPVGAPRPAHQPPWSPPPPSPAPVQRRTWHEHVAQHAQHGVDATSPSSAANRASTGAGSGGWWTLAAQAYSGKALAFSSSPTVSAASNVQQGWSSGAASQPAVAELPVAAYSSPMAASSSSAPNRFRPRY